MAKICVVAFGGNSISPPESKGDFNDELRHVDRTVMHLKGLLKTHKLVVTHGNGPQVGNVLLQQEISKGEIPPMPLHVCDAMTQGQIGYMIQNSLQNNLKVSATTVVTQVEVDRDDPGFSKPTKPVGPYYQNKIEENMVKEPEGWRRVVASPGPKRIVEINEIKKLIGKSVVIACGGGGIPVVKTGSRLEGVDAVIDKDYSTQKLATQLKANMLVFLSDVPNVFMNYNKGNQEPLREVNVSTVAKLLEEGHFREGSMGPKIRASIEFLKKGGKKVIITKPELLGKGGTVIT